MNTSQERAYRSLKDEAQSIAQENKMSKRPYYSKKYVCSRANSLAEFGRVYKYMLGSSKGLTKVKDEIKELYPTAKRIAGNKVEWHFQEDDLWAFYNNLDKEFLVHNRIDSWQELLERAYNI